MDNELPKMLTRTLKILFLIGFVNFIYFAGGTEAVKAIILP